MTQPIDLDAIEARANAASYGPWGIELRKDDDPADFPFFIMAEDWEISVALHPWNIARSRTVRR
jgi:hypothetical protein